ncbi:hypothetical protein LCGC14_2448190 [marine sediment metagenome]|uniref:Uncharacterized protein n=1 Tax=marine sediment metagenome TaxID=412755 RepID=A0A0F9DU05_9ZZZZ
MGKKIRSKIPKPKGPVQKPITVQEIMNMVTAKITNSVKSFIYPLKSVMDTRYKEYENLSANVIALQTMLMKKGIIDEKEFMTEYNSVLNNTIGRVDKDGRMSGYCGVEIYNMEENIP